MMVLSRMKLLNFLALSVLHHERFEWLNLRLDSNDSLCEFLILVVKFFSFELFPVVMKTAYKLLILVLVSNSTRQQSLLPLLLFLKRSIILQFTYCVDVLQTEENFFIALCDLADLLLAPILTGSTVAL